MSTLGIDTSRTLFALNRTNQALPNDSRQVGASQRINAPRHDYSRQAEFNNDHPAQTDDSTINPLARSISVADRAIEDLDKHIERMKRPLELIVKNYPPFPPESSERLEYLKRFIGIRMEIEQLTIPPDKDAERIMQDIKNINVPELTVTSTDKDVAAAIDGLDAASLALNSTRAALTAGFASTYGSEGYNNIKG